MDLNEQPKRPRGESIVPMINVVFLLLIFFLMTSQLTPPEPFEVIPPKADMDTEAEAGPVLFVGAEGRISFEGLGGEQALAALADRSGERSVVLMRADAGLEAKTLAAILRDLSKAGLSRVELVVERK